MVPATPNGIRPVTKTSETAPREPRPTTTRTSSNLTITGATAAAATTISTLTVDGSVSRFANETTVHHKAHLDLGSSSQTTLWVVLVVGIAFGLVCVSF